MGNNHKEQRGTVEEAVEEFDKLHNQMIALLTSEDNSTHLAIAVLMACLDRIMVALKKENNETSRNIHMFFRHAILTTANRWGEGEHKGEHKKSSEAMVRNIIFSTLNHSQFAEIISEHFNCSKSAAQQFLTSDTGHFCALGNRKDADHVWMSGMTIFKLLKHLSEKK